MLSYRAWQPYAKRVIMNPETLVANEVWNMLRFFSKNGGVWHTQVHVLAGRFDAPEKFVREILLNLYRLGLVSLKTWSKSACREVAYGECPTEDFFYNRDDANHVRVTPLFSF